MDPNEGKEGLPLTRQNWFVCCKGEKCCYNCDTSAWAVLKKYSTFAPFFPTSSSLPLELRPQARASGAVCPQRKCSQVPSPPRRFCTQIREESQGITRIKSYVSRPSFVSFATWQRCRRSLCSPSSHHQDFLSVLLLHLSQPLWLSDNGSVRRCDSNFFAAPGREFLYKGWSRPWMSRQDQEPLPQADRGIVCH